MNRSYPITSPTTCAICSQPVEILEASEGFALISTTPDGLRAVHRCPDVDAENFAIFHREKFRLLMAKRNLVAGVVAKLTEAGGIDP